MAQAGSQRDPSNRSGARWRPAHGVGAVGIAVVAIAILANLGHNDARRVSTVSSTTVGSAPAGAAASTSTAVAAIPSTTPGPATQATTGIVAASPAPTSGIVAVNPAPTTVGTQRPVSTTTATTNPAVTSPMPTQPTCPNGTYVNASGNRVCSPYAASTPPPGATAICNDGTYSMSQHRSGTCSGHGGVQTFLVNLP